MSEEESGNYLMAHAAGIATVLGYAFLLHLCGFLVSSVFRGTTSAWIRNAKKIRVGVPQPWASSYIRNPFNLPDYEQKVNRATIDKFVPDGLFYTLRGWWFGLPWKASFSMRYLDNGGFHSDVVAKKEGWARFVARLVWIDGGFTLSAEPDGTTWVCHYENYRWPLWFPFAWVYAPIWKRWHLRGMEEEMKCIKDAMELSYGIHKTEHPEAAAAMAVKAQRVAAGDDVSDGTASDPAARRDTPGADPAPGLTNQRGVRRRNRDERRKSGSHPESLSAQAAVPTRPSVPDKVSTYLRAHKYEGSSYVKEKVLCMPYHRPPIETVLDSTNISALRAVVQASQAS